MKCILELPEEVVKIIVDYAGNCRINKKGEIFTWNKLSPTDFRYFNLITQRSDIYFSNSCAERSKEWYIRAYLSNQNSHYIQMKYIISEKEDEILYQHTFRKTVRNGPNYVLSINLSDIYDKNEIYNKKMEALQQFYRSYGNEYPELTK